MKKKPDPRDAPMLAAKETLSQHFPGLGLFLIVMQKDGTISTTSNLPAGLRVRVVRDVLERQLELYGEPPLSRN